MQDAKKSRAGSRTLRVAALLLAAACTPGASTGPPPPSSPPGTELVRFTGEVDPATGRVEVRTLAPAPAAPAAPTARGRVVVPEGPGSLTVGMNGSWNGQPSPTGACGGASVTGANVVVTQRYGASSSPSFLGALYAQIDAQSNTGVSACTGAPAPTGLDARYGLWSYGSLNWGTPTAAAASSTAEWDWITASASLFTFTGTVRGVLGDLFSSGLDPACNGYTCIAWDGSHVVYGSAASASLVFVNQDGSFASRSDALPARASSLAADAANGRIWFTTDPLGGTAYAGYLDTAGTNVVSGATVASGTPTLGSIVVDPDDAGTAWFFQSVSGGGSGSGSFIYSIAVGGTPAQAFHGTGTGTVNGLAVLGTGGAKRIYLTYRTLDIIERYSAAGVLLDTVPSATLAAAGCSGPSEILADPAGGMLWFSAHTSGAVCTLSPSLEVVKVGAIANPRGLARTPGAGQVWAVSFSDTTASGEVRRMVPGDPAYPVAVPGTTSLVSIAASPAVAGPPAQPEFLWITNGAGGLVRLRP